MGLVGGLRFLGYDLWGDGIAVRRNEVLCYIVINPEVVGLPRCLAEINRVEINLSGFFFFDPAMAFFSGALFAECICGVFFRAQVAYGFLYCG